MLKKIALLFLFTGIFSLQAEKEMSNFSSYDQNIIIFSQNPVSKFLPKKPITEFTQVNFFAVLEAILDGSMLGVTVVAFYNNIQQIESIKKLIEQEKYAYLIGIDINKIEQEIKKNFFNITTEPTIIYYRKGQEVARSTNFDIKDVAHHIEYHLNTYVQQM